MNDRIMLVLLYRILQSLDISFFHLTPLLSSRARRNNLSFTFLQSKLNCCAPLIHLEAAGSKVFVPALKANGLDPGGGPSTLAGALG